MNEVHIPGNPEMENTVNMIAKELRAVSEVRARSLLDKERIILGHCGESAYLRYFGRQCAGECEMVLPENYLYEVEVIDVWEMTRMIVSSDVNGKIIVPLPGKEGIAVLAKVSSTVSD